VQDQVFSHMILTFLVSLGIITKDYLKKMCQNSITIPKGPLILAPNSPSVALFREVIVKTPESFKIEILLYIQCLFSSTTPFYSGFGNRITGLLSKY
jgi:phosphatidate phosphatase LPIN